MDSSIAGTLYIETSIKYAQRSKSAKNTLITIFFHTKLGLAR